MGGGKTAILDGESDAPSAGVCNDDVFRIVGRRAKNPIFVFLIIGSAMTLTRKRMRGGRLSLTSKRKNTCLVATVRGI